MKTFKETGNRNNASFRAKMGELNSQKSTLSEEKKQLEAKIASLEQELSSLRSSQTSNTEGNTATAAQIQELQKQNVRRSEYSCFKTDRALQASLRAECDKLLAEKEALKKAHPTSGETGVAAPTDWEAERAQLVKSRDEALEKIKVFTPMQLPMSQSHIPNRLPMLKFKRYPLTCETSGCRM